jgi:hypothetical protein
VGFRRLGDPFQGVQAAGGAPEPLREDFHAARVHAVTVVAPRASPHIPWDAVEDHTALAGQAREEGAGTGAINANVFQDDDCKLGSVTSPDPQLRRKAVDHLSEDVDVLDATGSADLKLWFSDGPNHPGQDDLLARQDGLGRALTDVLRTARGASAPPAGIQTVRTGLLRDGRSGPGDGLPPLSGPGAPGPERAGPERGRHRAPLPGEHHRVHRRGLLRPGGLGGSDLSSRFYADDDLLAGAADPSQLFRIMWEVRRGGGPDPGTQRERGSPSCSTSATTSSPRSQDRSVRSWTSSRDLACRPGTGSGLLPGLRSPGEPAGGLLPSIARDSALPAQRQGAVAAPRVSAHLGGGCSRVRGPGAAGPSGTGRCPAGRTRVRSRRSGAAFPGGQAVEDRPGLRGPRVGPAEEPLGVRPVRPGQPAPALAAKHGVWPVPIGRWDMPRTGWSRPRPRRNTSAWTSKPVGPGRG